LRRRAAWAKPKRNKLDEVEFLAKNELLADDGGRLGEAERDGFNEVEPAGERRTGTE
jgi:hypothetical protein